MSVGRGVVRPVTHPPAFPPRRSAGEGTGELGERDRSADRDQEAGGRDQRVAGPHLVAEQEDPDRAGSTVLVVNVTAATTVTRPRCSASANSTVPRIPLTTIAQIDGISMICQAGIGEVQAAGGHGDAGERQPGDEGEQHRRPASGDPGGECAEAGQRQGKPQQQPMPADASGGTSWACDDMDSRISPVSDAPSAIHAGRPSGRPERHDQRGHPDAGCDHRLHQEQRQHLQREDGEDETEQVDRQPDEVDRFVQQRAQVTGRLALGGRPADPERLDRRPDPGAQRGQDRERQAQQHGGILASGVGAANNRSGVGDGLSQEGSPLARSRIDAGNCAEFEQRSRVRGPAAHPASLAEDGGFEPPRALTQHAFQACAIGH